MRCLICCKSSLMAFVSFLSGATELTGVVKSLANPRGSGPDGHKSGNTASAAAALVARKGASGLGSGLELLTKLIYWAHLLIMASK